ncbi:MAG: phospholipase D-like domain-containing protein [Prevotellaceae bacterium]|jgi:cardiolipin synthase|nr:phospholipase D-like domain-containing protein [Prevotellaceae bacterium]
MPYFIPNESIVDAIVYAALSGVDMRMLVPGISDSRIVNAASSSYYGRLLKAGVKIYRYRKGFVHAKTIVSDDALAVVGSANMDIRSFDLNFEINALVFSKEINSQLCENFMKDIEGSEELNEKKWLQRGWLKQFGNAIARLISPLL